MLGVEVCGPLGVSATSGPRESTANAQQQRISSLCWSLLRYFSALFDRDKQEGCYVAKTKSNKVILRPAFSV